MGVGSAKLSKKSNSVIYLVVTGCLSDYHYLWPPPLCLGGHVIVCFVGVAEVFEE
jgi:hypothetical protein